ncbi:hypothetical protein ROZALSC1DRAFT_26863, partial [Rozella allomycis CSF55]
MLYFSCWIDLAYHCSENDRFKTTLEKCVEAMLPNLIHKILYAEYSTKDDKDAFESFRNETVAPGGHRNYFFIYLRNLLLMLKKLIVSVFRFIDEICRSGTLDLFPDFPMLPLLEYTLSQLKDISKLSKTIIGMCSKINALEIKVSPEFFSNVLKQFKPNENVENKRVLCSIIVILGQHDQKFIEKLLNLIDEEGCVSFQYKYFMSVITHVTEPVIIEALRPRANKVISALIEYQLLEEAFNFIPIALEKSCVNLSPVMNFLHEVLSSDKDSATIECCINCMEKLLVIDNAQSRSILDLCLFRLKHFGATMSNQPENVDLIYALMKK